MKVRGRGFSEYTPLEEALTLINSKTTKLGSENISFEKASSRVLSEDLKSHFDVPPFDRAAMDGFAVHAEDTYGADETEPKKLRLIGSVEAGSSSKTRVGRGEAVKIATGAPLPFEANSVVKLEEVEEKDSKIEILGPVTPGKNVSSRGEDVKKGDKILDSGHVIRPWDVGMLASTGNLKVKVRKIPHVGIAATGNELQAPGKDLDEAKITETNSYSLKALAEEYGASSKRLGSIPDRLEKITKTMEMAPDFDILLFTGGSSVGEKDLVPEVMSKIGEKVFHGVSIRPGGPTAFGLVKDTPVFSLPGFPTAVLISFEMLVGPTLNTMQGIPAESFRHKIEAKLVRKISSNLGRTDVTRVKVREKDGEKKVEPIRTTGSSILRTMVEADGLVVVPMQSEGFSKGETVKVTLL